MRETVHAFVNIPTWKVLITYQRLYAGEALTILQAGLPDLILMDIALPGISGADLTRQIKANSEWCHVPIIAFTAAAMKGEPEKFRDAGCDDYISKPVDTHALVDMVEHYLNLQIGK